MFTNRKIAKFLIFLFCFSIFSSISQTNEDVPLNNMVINEIPKPISSLIFEDFLGNEISFGISFITILLSGTSSFVCDIDEKILKQKKKIKNFKIF